MSLPARITLLFLPLLLAGCGFHPVYGQKDSQAVGASKLLAGVKIDTIEGRTGQQFHQELEDNLNPGGVIPPNPAYRLSVTLQSREAPIGVSRNGIISRYNVYLDSKYTLYRNSDGKEVTSGNLRNVSSYNNLTNAYFSTYVSEQDAIKRGITELAELYRGRLAAYLTADGGAPARP